MADFVPQVAQVGRLDASVDALWRMTQMGIAEAERTGMPAPTGSAVKLRYSECMQEITELTLRTIGRPARAASARSAGSLCTRLT